MLIILQNITMVLIIGTSEASVPWGNQRAEKGESKSHSKVNLFSTDDAEWNHLEKFRKH